MQEQAASRVMVCIQCGKCTGGCPESGRTPFNIRMLVRKKQFQYTIEEAIPWYCTACNTCTIRCPRDVKPSEMIIEIRATMVEEGNIPVTIQKALENTFVQKNPWGKPRSRRADWAEKTDFKVPHISETEHKRLLFSCCIHAYDPRCMVIPVNVARLLNRAGYEFGILGEEECCCGNEIRRIGESGLFEELMEENKANFEEYGIKEIIALSPHCMNTMKNEYGDMGIKVMHYTEVLSNLIEDGSLKIEKPIEGGIIYHDPCFLGKQNNIFEQPRGILKTLNGANIHEFARSREISLCCEGGGGRMFFDVEVPYQRNGEVRVLDAKKAGANTIATACPFCLMNLEDPAKEKDILVKDISEILSEVI